MSSTANFKIGQIFMSYFDVLSQYNLITNPPKSTDIELLSANIGGNWTVKPHG